MKEYKLSLFTFHISMHSMVLFKQVYVKPWFVENSTKFWMVFLLHSWRLIFAIKLYFHLLIIITVLSKLTVNYLPLFNIFYLIYEYIRCDGSSLSVCGGANWPSQWLYDCCFFILSMPRTLPEERRLLTLIRRTETQTSDLC